MSDMRTTGQAVAPLTAEQRGAPPVLHAASRVARSILRVAKRTGQTESLVYRPAGGVSRDFDAFVTRGEPRPIGGGNQGGTGASSPVILVECLNDPELGVSTFPDAAGRSLNLSGDSIDVAEIVGRTPAPRLAGRLRSQDADWLVIELR